MSEPVPGIAQDLATIGRIGAVPTILQVVARMTGMRFAAVARVTDTTWTALAVHDALDFGLKPGGELALESTICNEIRRHHQPVIFGQASAHPVFRSHHTPRQYGLESYVSVPIFKASGEFFGTLCAIDPLPAVLDEPQVIDTLTLFAQLIASHIDTEERLALRTDALLDARETARLREEFIAVLGHDLRSPIGSIVLGARMLRSSVDRSLHPTVDRILRSTRRMTDMVDDVLDFARGRLGAGIPISVLPDADLAAELRQVIAEVQAANPQRLIRSELAVPTCVTCDHVRVAQLLSNLLVNAMTYGASDQPVVVEAREDQGTFELSVANGGPAIPEEKRARLFSPFSRSVENALEPGLGLGLYIAAEIARAHRGTLDVTSSDAEGTRFVFRMPLVGGIS